MQAGWRGWVFLVWLGCTGATWAGPAEVERGRRLFHGEAPTAGRVTGHSADLPPEASRCVNCHTASAAPALPSAIVPAPAFGPALNADLLTREQPRRRGPPSRYDEAAFCKLLATGIDPAYIIIPRSMPRYEMPASDCQALWAYLTRAQP